MSSSVELNSEQKLSLSRNKVGDSFHTYDRVSLFIHVHTFVFLCIVHFNHFHSFTQTKEISAQFSHCLTAVSTLHPYDLLTL